MSVTLRTDHPAFRELDANELETLNQDYMRVKREIRSKQLELTAALDAALERQRGRAILDSLTPTARDSLVQTLRAEGIGSKESVNG